MFFCGFIDGTGLCIFWGIGIAVIVVVSLYFNVSLVPMNLVKVYWPQQLSNCHLWLQVAEYNISGHTPGSPLDSGARLSDGQHDHQNDQL